MTLVQLFRISPLGCVGTFLLGGVYAGIFGMASVFGTEKGLTVAQISAFVAAIYLGGLLFQYPIGWISDRMDRRRLIMGLTAARRAPHAPRRHLLGALRGGARPRLRHRRRGEPALFADHRLHQRLPRQPSDMAAASGGLLFINGLGAMTGPLVIGAVMTRFGRRRLLRLHRHALRADRALCALPRRPAAPRRARPRPTRRCCRRPRRWRSRWRRKWRSSAPARRLTRGFPFCAGSVRLPAPRGGDDGRRRPARCSTSGSARSGPRAGTAATRRSTRRSATAGARSGRRAAPARLDDWRCAPDSCLALLILLDQFPRNMFRDDARAFASDARALAVAKTAILHGIGPARAAAGAAVLLHCR